MSHNVKHYTYPENVDKKQAEASINEFVTHATWREHEGFGNTLERPIRWIDQILPDYDSAMRFIESHDKGWYDQLAVKYREGAPVKTSKKLDALRQKCIEAEKAYREAESKVVAKDFKAQLVTCKGCNSKLNKDYLKRNACPLCGTDMRSDTEKKRVARLKELWQKAQKSVEAEETAMRKKNQQPPKVKWLVKIEYHT